MTTQSTAKAIALRKQLEIGQRYGSIDAVDPHDGSVQREVELILEAALQQARREAIEEADDAK